MSESAASESAANTVEMSAPAVLRCFLPEDIEYSLSRTAKRSDWERLESRLRELEPRIGLVDEDELEFPTEAAFNAAWSICNSRRDSPLRGPDNLVMDGDGGLVLEFGLGADCTRLEIDRTGRTERLEIREGRLVSRILLVDG